MLLNTKEFRKDFVTELLVELLKNRPKNIHHDESFEMIKDISRYFDGEEEEKYKINPHVIGMRHLFRGHTVKA